MKWMRTYYSLDAAAEIAGCKAVDLLHFAVQKKCEIMFAIPDFIELRVFIQDENICEPPFIGLQPRLLVLSPENCLQIELNKACLQSDFRKGYVVSNQGDLNPMPTHYGRHHLMKTRCYWRTFKDGLVYFSEIGISQLIIRQDDLRSLVEQPAAASPQSDESENQPDTQPTKRQPRQTRSKAKTVDSTLGGRADTPGDAAHDEARTPQVPPANTESSKTTPAPSELPNVAEKKEMSPKVLRKKQVREMTGLSYSTIYAKLNPKSKQYDPTFPKQFRISTGIVGWYQTEIATWLKSRRDQP